MFTIWNFNSPFDQLIGILTKYAPVRFLVKQPGENSVKFPSDSESRKHSLSSCCKTQVFLGPFSDTLRADPGQKCWINFMRVFEFHFGILLVHKPLDLHCEAFPSGDVNCDKIPSKVPTSLSSVHHLIDIIGHNVQCSMPSLDNVTMSPMTGLNTSYSYRLAMKFLL